MADDTLHASIATAFEQVAEATPAPLAPSPPPVVAPSTPSLAEAVPELAEVAEGVPTASAGERDAAGRFKKKEGTEDVPAPAAPAVPTAAPAAAPLDDPFAEAPQSWVAAKREHWAQVPPEIRSYLHQRESELQQGFTKVAQRGNIAEAVLNEFVPYAEVLQNEGATPITAMRTLLQTAHALRTGGTEYRKAILMSLAQQYGVDLAQPYNPDLAKAQAETQTLSTEKMYFAANNQSREVATMQQQIDAFGSDPKNEFFPAVRQLMGQLIGAGVAPDLGAAYTMAVGMHPEVRKEMNNREWASREAALRKSSAGSMSVTGAPSGQVAATPGTAMSLRDTIAAQMSGVSG